MICRFAQKRGRMSLGSLSGQTCCMLLQSTRVVARKSAIAVVCCRGMKRVCGVEPNEGGREERVCVQLGPLIQWNVSRCFSWALASATFLSCSSPKWKISLSSLPLHSTTRTSRTTRTTLVLTLDCAYYFIRERCIYTSTRQPPPWHWHSLRSWSPQPHSQSSLSSSRSCSRPWSLTLTLSLPQPS